MFPVLEQTIKGQHFGGLRLTVQVILVQVTENPTKAQPLKELKILVTEQASGMV